VTIVILDTELAGIPGLMRVCAAMFGPGRQPMFLFAEQRTEKGWQRVDSGIEAAAQLWLLSQLVF
jgi:hypothetical protein